MRRKARTSIGLAVWLVTIVGTGSTARAGPATIPPAREGAPALGSPDFMPSPQCPVGWRGVGTGHYPGARPPLHWGRSCRQMRDLKCAAAVPKDTSATDAAPASNGFFSEWLVAAPVASGSPVKAIKELTPEEASLAPNEGDKLGDAAWRRVQVEDSLIDAWKRLGEMTKDQAAYVQACLYAERPTRIWFHFNHARGAAFWFNGKLKYSAPEFPAGLGQMGPTLALGLEKGWNRFLFKLTPRTPKATDFPPACFLRGHFWLADEPREYDQTNIAWITPMPGLSQAMPIVVGDRLFTTAHLYNLVCVDKKTGKILWIRQNSPYDAATEAERKAAPEAFAAMDALAAQRDAYYRDYVAGKPPDEQAVKAGLDLEDQLDELMLGVDPVKYKKPDEQGEGHRPWWEIPTPASDGRNVCVWLTRGVSACYGVDGTRRWIRYERPRYQHHGFFGSPVIADGKLVILDGTLSALDLSDGSVQYSIGLGELKDWRLWFASLSRAVIGGTEYIVCPTGRSLVRARDGKVFGPGYPSNHDSTPLYQDGTILHALQAQAGLWRVKPTADGGVSLESPQYVKWPAKRLIIPGLYCGDWLEASPLIHEGLGYVVSYSGVLAVFDLATLEIVYQKELPLDQLQGAGWSGFGASPTLAGGYIYLMGPTGVTIVIKPGRQYQEVARNRIQFLSRAGRNLGALSYFRYNPQYCPEYQECTLTSTPVFDGTRMYFRGQENLYCIEESPESRER